MPVYIDQLNREVTIVENPSRIISLVPSQTELLYDLGLEEEVVGITKFCVHPTTWFRNKTRIGGTKNINPEKITALQPDLVIANKEENVKEQVEELAKNLPVWVSDVNTLNDAIRMITAVGEITGKKEKAETIAAQIEKEFIELTHPSADGHLRTCYLIWKDPYMTVGGDTLIHQILAKAGFSNIFKNNKRYPEVDIKELQSLDCELLLLSSEPYPFNQKHITELQAQLPSTKIILVDGEMFSWYGSRLLKAPRYLTNLHHQIRP